MTTLEGEEMQSVIYLHSRGAMVISGTVVATRYHSQGELHHLGEAGHRVQMEGWSYCNLG